MQRFDLAAMIPSARWRGHTALHGPRMDVPLGIERQYVAELRKAIREMHKIVARDIWPLVEAEAKAQRLTRDAVDLLWFRDLRVTGERLARSIFGAQGRLRSLLLLQIQQHTSAWVNGIRRTLGVQAQNLIDPEDVEREFENGLVEGLSATTGVLNDLATAVERAATSGVARGSPVVEIRKAIRVAFEKADDRAQMIARDQTGGLHARLTHARHEQAGIEQYEWATRKDERVRRLHTRLQGRIYRYGEPTGAERGLPPGEPYACRCTGIPIIRLRYRPR